MKNNNKVNDENLDNGLIDDCVFCKIIRGEIPAKVVAENDYATAFLDIEPISEGHTIIIPKKHFLDLGVCDPDYLNGVISLTQIVSQIIDKSKLGAWGFNYLSNQGSIAGQVVNHFHMHVIPKYAKKEGLEFSAEHRYFEHNPDEVYELLLNSAHKMEKKGRFFSKISDRAYK